MQQVILDIGYKEEEKALILVVDDEPALQSLVFDTLADDYRLIRAYNGREAIQTAERQKPNLILMDVMMPDIGGYEAVRLLKGNYLTKDIPIIMISANDFDSSTINLIKNESNVKGFLMKPFRPNQLRAIVKEYVLPLK